MRTVISEGTLRIYGRVISRYHAAMKLTGRTNNAKGFAEELRQAPPRSRSTWRQHKAAIAHYLETAIGPEEASHFRALAPTAQLPKTKPQRHLKSIPPEALTLIIGQLLHRPTPLKKLCSDLIIATIVTGIRPVEWSSVKRTGNRLSVDNAKYQPDLRGNGPTRVLYLNPEQTQQHQLAAIDAMIEAGYAGRWQHQGRQLRATLKNALRKLVTAKLLPPRYLKLRLYDARHQFASDAKGDRDLLSGEIAALMGHRSARTAYRAYGRRRAAANPTAVRPSPESIAAVSERSLQAIAALVAPHSKHNNGPTPAPISTPKTPIEAG